MFNVTRDHNVFGLQRLLTELLLFLFDLACSLRPSKGNIDAETKTRALASASCNT